MRSNAFRPVSGKKRWAAPLTGRLFLFLKKNNSLQVASLQTSRLPLKPRCPPARGWPRDVSRGAVYGMSADGCDNNLEPTEPDGVPKHKARLMQSEEGQYAKVTVDTVSTVIYVIASS